MENHTGRANSSINANIQVLYTEHASVFEFATFYTVSVAVPINAFILCQTLRIKRRWTAINFFIALESCLALLLALTQLSVVCLPSWLYYCAWSNLVFPHLALAAKVNHSLVGVMRQALLIDSTSKRNIFIFKIGINLKNTS